MSLSGIIDFVMTAATFLLAAAAAVVALALTIGFSRYVVGRLKRALASKSAARPPDPRP